jgi:DNA-binding transcriptional MerR regulator
MRISQLSAESGVSVATIKYYVREGLLPEGNRRAENQVDYDETHVRRLALIRALVSVAGLSIAATRTVLDAVASDLELGELFEIAQRTVSERPGPVEDDALAIVDGVVEGWQFRPDNPGRLAAARVLTALDSAGQGYSREWLRGYAAAARAAAEVDINELGSSDSREKLAETVVLGTIFGDALFAALRRIAQEDASVRRMGGEAPR